MNLDEMIQTQEYNEYASETVYSIQDHCIDTSYDTTPDIMEEHNEAGMFGVTHNDVIENQRNYLNTLDLDENTYDAIEKEINEVEEWHIKNKSIEEII